MNLDRGSHSMYNLNYHLVLVIKYRCRVITDVISDRLKEIFEIISPTYNIGLEEWNHDADHIHLLFKGTPCTDIVKFINTYKSASSRLIKKRISSDKTITMERIFLVKKLLFGNYRWCTN